MKNRLTSLISIIFGLIILFSPNIVFLSTEMVFASEDQNSALVNKISSDFTKKFCNSIGFGLSKESAMKFSFSENKEVFKNRKGIKNINKELLANKISTSVINGCGYQLNLFGDKDIEEFANFYLSIDQEENT